MNNTNHKEINFVRIPDVIIEYIFEYVDPDISLHFQKRYPNLIRKIRITKPNMIVETLRFHVRNICVEGVEYPNEYPNEYLHQLTNLQYLECSFTNVTDDALLNLVNLTKLKCDNCHNINGSSFK